MLIFVAAIDYEYFYDENFQIYRNYPVFIIVYLCHFSVPVSFWMSYGCPSRSVMFLESLVRNCSILSSPSGRWPSSPTLAWRSSGWCLELCRTEATSSASHGQWENNYNVHVHNITLISSDPHNIIIIIESSFASCAWITYLAARCTCKTMSICSKKC